MEELEKTKPKKVDTKSQLAAQELKDKVGVTNEAKLKVTAAMAGVGVIVCSANVDLAQAFVKGFSAKVDMQDDKLEIQAHMVDLQLQDNGGNSKFPKIISMQSDQVFDLEVVVFTDGTKGSKALDMSAVDTIIKLNMGQMRAVFLYRFVMDILSFVDQFEDAKHAIVEAGIAAKDKAVAAATEYSKHNSRNKLNITIRAPVIVVPVDSNSQLALLVDLGEIRIFNTFYILNKQKQHGKHAVITDDMTIRLSDLKVFKALINDGKDIAAQRALVKPMNLKLNIVRNLTSGDHSIPDIAIKGMLQTITMVMSEEDVSVALKILQGNIAEGQARAPEKKESLLDNQDTLIVPEMQDRLASIYEDDVDATYVKTSFKFDLEKIVLQVYLKAPDTTFEEEFNEREEELFLSQFTIGHMGFVWQYHV